MFSIINSYENIDKWYSISVLFSNTKMALMELNMSKNRYICHRILLTNDDGFDARGLEILSEIARGLAPEVWIVAPSEERSGASQSINLHRSLTCLKRGEYQYTVTGSPADCVALACMELMRCNLPDLILSGINRGGNLGNETVFSGTVGAAMTGLLLGIPSIALSQNIDKDSRVTWETSRIAAPDIIRHFYTVGWPADACLNINFPPINLQEAGEYTVTSQGAGRLQRFDIKKENKNQSDDFTFTIDLGHVDCCNDLFDETGGILAGHITVTPLRYNRTHDTAMEFLKKL
ncbi:5'/3'-nucleotidase SurE [Klebsiella pasteurii]|uniref:5'/3'-nucleotidase SurE n=3 Tax=Klebsiella TaxID=570 RepID=UPI0020730242|nr:5'/3'-nucleotidase SurE [Klebsiella pasteurii]MCM6077333.1 5'/3'-nucleotidase SurE [Klebsiella pneumoniae]MDV1908988.1 5'/3'-nucleotidase SurE [Klebsiella pasteurii]MDV1914767.1 5'/3'-nucleotidase SurE [Klebsiella pasteurii]HED2698193.1 5'/3'-nucleotidase SurE [Klebsiella michiganensis]